VCAGFVLGCAAAKGDLFLGHKIGATHIVPAVDGRIETFLQLAAHIEQSGAARAEQPFVRVRGQEIDVFDSGGKCAEGLDGVEAKEDAALAQALANGLEIDAVAADEMTGGESDQPGVFVNLAQNIEGTNDTKAACVQQSHFDALPGQGHPRIDV